MCQGTSFHGEIMQALKILAIAAAAAAFAANATAQCSNFANSPSGTLIFQADDSVRIVGLPFAFPFNGVNYTSITISSNGWLKLGSSTSTGSDFTDSEATMLNSLNEPRIAVCWDDLTSVSPQPGVFYAADATQASVTWKARSFATATALANCECILTPAGDIYLNYDASCNYATSASTSLVGISKSNNSVLAGTHTFDWTLANPGPLAVVDATGYQVFANLGFDLGATTLHFAPTGVDTYDVTTTTLGTCTPGTYPPLSSATTTSVGTGCPAAVPNGAIYQNFTVNTGLTPQDLANTSIEFVRTGGTYTITPGPGLDPNYTTNGVTAVQGDDTLVTVAGGAMGTFQFGDNQYTQVVACSNGFVWMGSGTSTDLTPTSSELRTLAARIAPMWMDFNFNTAGTFYVENTNPAFVQLTWSGVAEFGQATSLHTFQLTMRSNGNIVFSYGAMNGGVTHVSVVGMSGGSVTVDPLTFDLVTAGVPNALTRLVTGVQPMTYTVNNAPRIGQTFTMTSTIPAGNNGIGAFAIGGTNPALPLDSIFGAGFAPGCTAYTDILETFFVLFPSSQTTFTVSLPLPYDLNLAGLALTSQAAGFSPLNLAGLLTSNGRTFTTGL